jgi:Ferritin-like
VPTPEFRWSEFEVRVPRTSPLIGFRAALRSPVAAGESTTVIPLPDLRSWQSPLDKAKILLESAAEIEHALMVQYLYAAYSLKNKEEVTDAAQKKVLNEGSATSWPNILLGIAREEMGHLLTVQNLLLAMGLAPTWNERTSLRARTCTRSPFI